MEEELITPEIRVRQIYRNVHSNQKIYTAAWSPDGKYFATGATDGIVHLWGISSEKMLRKSTDVNEIIFSIAWSPDAKMLAIGTSKNKDNIEIWDIENEIMIKNLNGHSLWVTKLAWSPDGNMLASCATDNVCIIWKVPDWEIQQKMYHESSCQDIVWTYDINKIVTRASLSNNLLVWELSSGNCTKKIKGLLHKFQCSAYQSDRKVIALGGIDGKMIIWNLGNNNQKIINAHSETLLDISFSSDDRFIVTRSRDKSLKIWRSDTLELIELIKDIQLSRLYSSALFDPRSSILSLITGKFQNDIIFWEIDLDRLSQKSTIENIIQQEINDDFISIKRSIEFPPEYKQAGVSILNYFSEVLEKKYPEAKATVQIKQDGLKVTMTIDPVNGDPETIEKTLDEYGLVVTGKMAPEVFTDDKHMIMELKQELRIAKLRIETQKDLLQDKSAQVDKLLSIVGDAVKSKPSINISTGDKTEIEQVSESAINIKSNIENASQTAIVDKNTGDKNG